LTAFLQNGSFDIAHSHLLHANVLGISASRIAGIPVVGTLHNVHITRRSYHTLRYGLETLLLRHVAAGVMAVGGQTADAHRQRLGSQAIYVIPVAVEVPQPLSFAEREALRVELAGDSAHPLLVSVGRLTEQKGYADLLAAFAQVHRRHPTAKLVIVGEGRLSAKLSQQIKDLRLENHARLLGPRSDVQRLLGACDVFVSSSLWEGLPSALLEAMVAGLPVVATTVGDIPKVVTPEYGLLVPPSQQDALAEKLASLLDQPQRMQAMGQAARQYASKAHGLENWTVQFRKMYEEVLQRRDAQRRLTTVTHNIKTS
jgi:glycosyltransferase involved in cell wall biosynthesis